MTPGHSAAIRFQLCGVGVEAKFHLWACIPIQPLLVSSLSKSAAVLWSTSMQQASGAGCSLHPVVEHN